MRSVSCRSIEIYCTGFQQPGLRSPMNVTILDDYFDTLRHLPCFAKLADFNVRVWTDHVQEIDALAARLQDTDVLVLFRERTQITAALLDRLPRLKLISQRSVYPHVDVRACTRNGVLLCSNMHAGTPSYAAAEHTLALILASVRQLPQQMASLHAGEWQMGVGKTLRGGRLGLYGYGRIAKAVAGYARALGMRVWFWASDGSRQRARQDDVEVAPSRAAFFSESAVVSLHVRLYPATCGLITAADLARMRPDALLVNTARAPLIEAGALQAAIEQGRPGFAAVDVFEQEPVIDPPAWLRHPRVVATPHIGYVTEEEYDLQFSDIYDQIVAFARGEPIHMINPPMLSANRPR